jgi:hypothetical protein
MVLRRIISWILLLEVFLPFTAAHAFDFAQCLLGLKGVLGLETPASMRATEVMNRLRPSLTPKGRLSEKNNTLSGQSLWFMEGKDTDTISGTMKAEAKDHGTRLVVNAYQTLGNAKPLETAQYLLARMIQKNRDVETLQILVQPEDASRKLTDEEATASAATLEGQLRLHPLQVTELSAYKIAAELGFTEVDWEKSGIVPGFAANTFYPNQMFLALKRPTPP